MSFEIPDNRRYLETHEWVQLDGETARVGISDFAQDELGDVVFVELPDVGSDVTQEDSFGVVESIKAVSDLYAPVSGTITSANEALLDHPELVNDDPYGEGWIIEVELEDPDEYDDLLSAADYEDQIA